MTLESQTYCFSSLFYANYAQVLEIRELMHCCQM
jgi:hypothetical protein